MRVDVGKVHEIFRKTLQFEWRLTRTINRVKGRKILYTIQLFDSIIIPKEKNMRRKPIKSRCW
jgi:hypothetical protein